MTKHCNKEVKTPAKNTGQVNRISWCNRGGKSNSATVAGYNWNRSEPEVPEVLKGSQRYLYYGFVPALAVLKKKHNY